MSASRQADLLPKLRFNRSVTVQASDQRLSAEPGALILREAMERLGLVRYLTRRLEDPRDQARITHPLAELILTNVLLLALGWRDQDDADALRHDPLLRLSVSKRAGQEPLAERTPEERERSRNPAVPDGLASQPTLSRMHAALASEKNREVLHAAPLEVARRLQLATCGGLAEERTIDIDSLPVEVHGHQPGAEYNGYYHATVYHPLVASIGETGDLIDLRLRNGKVHTADGALSYVLGLVDAVEGKLCRKASVRFDAGFPEDELLAALEKRGTKYVARIKNNAVLGRMAEPFLKRPPGRPPEEPRTWFYETSYQAKSWSCPRRVVLVVQERPGSLTLNHFWLLTSYSVAERPGEVLLEHYRVRGSAEARFGELMSVLDPALSSSPRRKSNYREEPMTTYTPSGDSFAINEVRLLFSALAYQVMHVVRKLLELETRDGWSLRKLRERVLRVASRVTLHARGVKVALDRAAAELWRILGARLEALALPGS